MRGQSSAEFMIIIAAFLVVLASFTVPQIINPARSTSRDVKLASQARFACDEITNAMNGISASGTGAVDSLEVSIPDNWSMVIEKNPTRMKIGVQIDGETVWMEDNLVYGFDDSLRDIPPGSYVVIVERGGEEGIQKSGDRIYININPIQGGGEWRY
ncbi:hypothetical protein AKJ65_03415 [candidate division MSBL1 archaeon SCGC-AAA259E19]|uniref:Uncharacterized protein n=2 Tax=candidate division MSBL1 TaxID=215777 RepID=A0A133V4R7_9EURY|nr:hypothetical protein AKJ65_03415 [candidate division MSBL1 archaeon SCGC-AAA259E19]KXB01440.1 hypothetical protein AKJ41_01475 [candidate division MSBL1 archaeon SCGC-AAA259O05]